MNLRVSVTSIDSWLYTLSHENADVQKLLSDLRGEGVRSEPMIASSALHRALERAEPGESNDLIADGYRFIIKPDVELTLPAIRELKLEVEIPIDAALTVTQVGKVDGLEGRTVYDHKGTKKFEPDYFLDSFQWKQYLNMSGADTFQWNVFEIDWERWTMLGDCKELSVTGYHELRQYRYPGMADDCMDLLRGFLSFLDVRSMRWPSQDCTLRDLLRANR